jgi:two-component system, sensor histidine kinase PdtaS
MARTISSQSLDTRTALPSSVAYVRGRITIDYQSSGPDWTLAVHDDGVGMHSETAGTTPGLGTSIIEALAKQLHARVQVADAGPGTAVSIVHSPLAGLIARAI